MAKEKTKEKEQARHLRSSGKSIPEISRLLKVSKSSVSSWVKDIPQPYQFTTEFKSNRKAQRLKRLAEERRKRDANKPKCLLLSGRWVIRTPEGYKGKTYIDGRYILQYRYLMEQKLGRLLKSNEVVHHKDGDKLNDSLENLEVMTNSDHASYHSKPGETMTELTCSYCGIQFTRVKRNTYNRKKYYCCREHMHLRKSKRTGTLVAKGSHF